MAEGGPIVGEGAGDLADRLDELDDIEQLRREVTELRLMMRDCLAVVAAMTATLSHSVDRVLKKL